MASPRSRRSCGGREPARRRTLRGRRSGWPHVDRELLRVGGRASRPGAGGAHGHVRRARRVASSRAAPTPRAEGDRVAELRGGRDHVLPAPADVPAARHTRSAARASSPERRLPPLVRTGRIGSKAHAAAPRERDADDGLVFGHVAMPAQRGAGRTRRRARSRTPREPRGPTPRPSRATARNSAGKGEPGQQSVVVVVVGDAEVGDATARGVALVVRPLQTAVRRRTSISAGFFVSVDEVVAVVPTGRQRARLGQAPGRRRARADRGRLASNAIVPRRLRCRGRDGQSQRCTPRSSPRISGRRRHGRRRDDHDRDAIRALNASAAFNRRVGIEVVAASAGTAELRLPWHADLGQYAGFLHAAMIAGMIDTACGFAAFTLVGPVLASHFSVNCLATAAGAAFVARAQRRQGRPAPGLRACRPVRAEGRRRAPRRDRRRDPRAGRKSAA